MPRKIPYRNKSPYGWWIASYLERFEYEGEDKSNLNRRCFAWENTILIRAPNREQAYRKAIKFGSIANGSRARNQTTGRKGRWCFEGLTSLLPIYDKLEDGEEVLWKEHRNRTVKTIKSWVKRKKDLETFIDD